jgi:KUP system potassium uptake protein
MPALVLNYFGQGAMLLATPKHQEPLLPDGAGLGAVPAGRAGHRGHGDRVAGADHGGLLGHQAGHAAGLLPRMRMLHTSVKDTGQIYVPFVNWALYACIVLAVVFFGPAARWPRPTASRSPWT